ncbi:unnamed protein product [Adineta ricciae]|uniref:NAD(P)(+)--arginine ADP-ribosyltransferase n=1 Tax=Adineta ricciae TaxID=249248 RepID=A0A815MJ51_ADIRI|nr:unnamed protein product [Adineta ricciae]
MMAERLIPQRFLDADKEPDQYLMPIADYEKYPLVSLKASVEPIKSLLFNCDTMVEIALRSCRRPSDALTQDESASIHLYTMQWSQPHASLYQLLNERLRSKNRESLIVWFHYLKLFFTALFKLRSIRGIVYRGVRQNLSNDYDEDHIWWGLSSCTEKLNVMEAFIGTHGSRTIFNIECFNGKPIRPHSHFQDEEEILLLPGTYFKVVDKWNAGNGLFIVHLKEEIPPYETLTPPFDVFPALMEKLAISGERKPLSARISTISKASQVKFNKWRQSGKTMAGGNGGGRELNQLDGPQGIFIDDSRHIFIADWRNNRIVEWKPDGHEGTVIIGENGQGSRLNQLNYPIGVIVDKQNNSLIIADSWNRRVIRWWDRNQQDILIENIRCSSLAIDKDGYLGTFGLKRVMFKTAIAREFAGQLSEMIHQRRIQYFGAQNTRNGSYSPREFLTPLVAMNVTGTDVKVESENTYDPLLNTA